MGYNTIYIKTHTPQGFVEGCGESLFECRTTIKERHFVISLKSTSKSNFLRFIRKKSFKIGGGGGVAEERFHLSHNSMCGN